MIPELNKGFSVSWVQDREFLKFDSTNHNYAVLFWEDWFSQQWNGLFLWLTGYRSQDIFILDIVLCAPPGDEKCTILDSRQ